MTLYTRHYNTLICIQALLYPELLFLLVVTATGGTSTIYELQNSTTENQTEPDWENNLLSRSRATQESFPNQDRRRPGPILLTQLLINNSCIQ